MEVSVRKTESGELVKSGGDWFLLRPDEAKGPDPSLLRRIADKMMSGMALKKILHVHQISHLKWAYWLSRDSKVQEMLSVVRRARVQMAQDEIGGEEFDKAMRKNAPMDKIRKFEAKQQVLERQRRIDAPGEEKAVGGGSVVINVGYDEEKLATIREPYMAKPGDIVEVKSRDLIKKERVKNGQEESSD